ncbi:hypothetical protein D3C72_1963700 [compost metagenome]
MELLGDFRHHRQAAVIHQQLDEAASLVIQRGLQHRQEQFGQLVAGNVRIVGDRLHVGIGGNLPHFRHQLGPCTQVACARFAGDAEQRLSVGTGNGCGFSHD